MLRHAGGAVVPRLAAALAIAVLAIAGGVDSGAAAGADAPTYYASPVFGSDTHPGTSPTQPFATAHACILHATKAAPSSPTGGATCVLLDGDYLEAVNVTLPSRADGTAQTRANAKPTVLIQGRANATTGARPRFCGGDAMPASAWRREPSMHNGSVWSAPLTLPPGVGATQLQQVLLDQVDPVADVTAPGGVSAPMLGFEARWPNVNVSTLLSTSSWAPTGVGSRYGRIVDPHLAATGINWTGALATLQVAHRFYTWTRVVSTYDNESSTFTYPKDLPGITSYANLTRPWELNQYFLSGKLEALDSPGEWFFQAAASDGERTATAVAPGPAGVSGRLYFWPNDGQAPMGRVRVKRRDICLSVRAGPAAPFAGAATVDGVDFAGCAVQVHGNGNTLANSRLVYASYDKFIPEMNPPSSKGSVVASLVQGNWNTVANVSIAYNNNIGLAVSGNNNTVDNALILNTDWLGTLVYPPLGVNGHGNHIERVTADGFGNAGIVSHNTSNEVAHCHILNGGLIGLDHAALYTGGWLAAGTEWHHNWIHDHREKCLRGDDQSHNMTVHHNVIWNCGEPVGDRNDDGIGIVLKGNYHRVYANTVFNASSYELGMPACQEPYKPWLPHQWPLDPHQNNYTLVFNSIFRTVSGRPSCGGHNGTTVPGGHRFADFNGTVAAMQLKNPEAFDFTPQASSPLVDAGQNVPPYTNGHVGSAPDIGAYEYGGAAWVAGCTIDPRCGPAAN